MFIAFENTIINTDKISKIEIVNPIDSFSNLRLNLECRTSFLDIYENDNIILSIPKSSSVIITLYQQLMTLLQAQTIQ